MKTGVPKWLIVVSLVALACLATVYLTTPLPPPKMVLAVGSIWLSDATNTFISVSLKNMGTSEVQFNDQQWQATIETPSGWLTNRAPFASVGGGGIDPGESQAFTVHLPTDATHWKITARYRYYRRRDVYHDAWTLIDKTGFWEYAPEFASDAAVWCLQFLSHEMDGEDVVVTRFFTNLPPVQPWPPK